MNASVAKQWLWRIKEEVETGLLLGQNESLQAYKMYQKICDIYLRT